MFYHPPSQPSPHANPRRTGSRVSRPAPKALPLGASVHTNPIAKIGPKSEPPSSRPAVSASVSAALLALSKAKTKAGTKVKVKTNQLHTSKNATEMGVDDPRWALAVQTSMRLEGAILRPYDRAILLKLGQTLGLNPFDSNLVISITQDQARRGLGPEAGIRSLKMISPPQQKLKSICSARNIFFWCSLAFVLEMILIFAMM